MVSTIPTIPIANNPLGPVGGKGLGIGVKEAELDESFTVIVREQFPELVFPLASVRVTAALDTPEKLYIWFVRTLIEFVPIPPDSVIF